MLGSVGYIIMLCSDNCFLEKIMELNFCYRLTSSQKEKLCKCRGRRWKRLLYCPVVSLFSRVSQELSCLCCDLFLQLSDAAPGAPGVSDLPTLGFRGARSCPETPGCSSVSSALGPSLLQGKLQPVVFSWPADIYCGERVCITSPDTWSQDPPSGLKSLLTIDCRYLQWLFFHACS